MLIIPKTLSRALSIMFKDKIVLLFSMIPVFIGVVLYLFLGRWLHGLFQIGMEYLGPTATSGFLGAILYYFLVLVVTVLLLIIINYTFVLLISIIACPFNDIISSRVERIAGGTPPLSFKESLKQMMKRISRIIINEAKKISVIIFFSAVAFGIGLVPALVTISVIIASFLLAVQFLDYSWCRHEYSLGQCFSDIKGSFISYALSGGLFLFLMSVPVVNVVALPYGVIYFTVLFCEKKSKDSFKDVLEQQSE